MGLLDNIERGLERAVNNAFAKTFRSGVQPVEIASALKRELDVGSVIVDRDRVLTPNQFRVRVSPSDIGRLEKLGETLERELRGVVNSYAQKQGYQMVGEADVAIVEDTKLSSGVLQIDAKSVEGAVSWVAAMDVAGQRHTLHQGVNVIGRGSDADIRISDNGASRKHLEIHWDGKTAIAKDLGSTNGSKVNGQRFREATLAPDTTVTIGQTSLRFVLVPQRAQRTGSGRGPGDGTAPGLRNDPANNSFWSSL